MLFTRSLSSGIFKSLISKGFDPVTNYTVAIAQLIEAAKLAQAQQCQQAQAGN